MPCTPRMRGCAASCLHRQLVLAYRDARDAWELQLEAETSLYAAEVAEWTAANPGPTFKRWLEGQSGARAHALDNMCQSEGQPA